LRVLRTRLLVPVLGLVVVASTGALPRAPGAAPTPPAVGVSAAPVPPAAELAAADAPALDAAETAGDARGAAVDAALSALSALVSRQSHPDALRLAFQAYYNFRSARPEEVRNPYLYFVDYGLGSTTPRGYVFDMEALELVDGPFIVAHGRGSSKGRTGVPTRFSNIPGSATTSLGLFLTQETYGFSGKSAGRHYTSIGLRLEGVSGRFNSTARSRGVVVHGAPYVTPGGAGRSEGCPAMEQARARRLIPKIANGGMVFLFSPRDTTWMQQDSWMQGAAADGVVAAES
jgi:hypothetical protein